MKKLILALSIFLFASSAQVQAQNKKEIPLKKTEKVYFTCKMDCQNCEDKIGEELRFTKGVKDVVVDFTTSTVYVEFKVSKTDKNKIIEAIKKKEYTPKEITEVEYKALTKK